MFCRITPIRQWMIGPYIAFYDLKVITPAGGFIIVYTYLRIITYENSRKYFKKVIKSKWNWFSTKKYNNKNFWRGYPLILFVNVTLRKKRLKEFWYHEVENLFLLLIFFILPNKIYLHNFAQYFRCVVGKNMTLVLFLSSKF